MRLSEITKDEIRQWRSDLVAQNFTANTIRLATAALKNVLSLAVENKLLPENPAFKLKEITARKPPREPQAMEPDETTAFLEAASDDEYFHLFLISSRAGLRQGEGLAVK